MSRYAGLRSEAIYAQLDFLYGGNVDKMTGVDGTASISKALELLRAVGEDGSGAVSLRDHAVRLGLPLSTCYRMIDALRREGLVAPAARGRFVPGLGLFELVRDLTASASLAATARPLLRRLARAENATAHLGVFEDDMVTYIVKEEGGAEHLFTQEGGQLEAYCSAIGRVLLADLAGEKLDAYLASAPLIPLTSRTIISTQTVRSMLSQVREKGFAIDDQEIEDGLRCIAVPVRGRSGKVIAAISLASSDRQRAMPSPTPALLACQQSLDSRLWRSL